MNDSRNPAGTRSAPRGPAEGNPGIRPLDHRRTDPCLTWREGLRCVELIEAANRSQARQGEWVQLPLYPDLEAKNVGS